MKMAVIGCGVIGKKRAQAFPNHVELVGCFDEITSKAEIFAAEFNTKTFSSPEELLATPDLSFVVIATRFITHPRDPGIECRKTCFCGKTRSYQLRKIQEYLRIGQEKQVKSTYWV